MTARKARATATAGPSASLRSAQDDRGGEGGSEKQVPFGNDSEKGKGNGKSATATAGPSASLRSAQDDRGDEGGSEKQIPFGNDKRGEGKGNGNRRFFDFAALRAGWQR